MDEVHIKNHCTESKIKCFSILRWNLKILGLMTRETGKAEQPLQTKRSAEAYYIQPSTLEFFWVDIKVVN